MHVLAPVVAPFLKVNCLSISSNLTYCSNQKKGWVRPMMQCSALYCIILRWYWGLVEERAFDKKQGVCKKERTVFWSSAE